MHAWLYIPAEIIDIIYHYCDFNDKILSWSKVNKKYYNLIMHDEYVNNLSNEISIRANFKEQKWYKYVSKYISREGIQQGYPIYSMYEIIALMHLIKSNIITTPLYFDLLSFFDAPDNTRYICRHNNLEIPKWHIEKYGIWYFHGYL